MKSDFYEELKDGIESFKEIISKYKNHENIEIELRIGQIQFDKFISGLNNKNFFDKIRTNLDSSQDFKKKTFKTEEKIKNGYRKTVKLNNTRVNKDIVKKERVLKMDFKYNNTPSAGTFSSGSFKYGRISNYSSTVPINLKISSSSELMNFSIAAGGTFMLSTSDITGSLTNTFSYDDIMSVFVEPSGSSAKVEYFIATT